MEKYYVVINKKEYELPSVLKALNEKTFEEYTIKNNNKNYLDIEKMIKENKKEELLKIDYQCTLVIQEIIMDDDNQTKTKWNKLGPTLRLLDDMIKINFQKNNPEKAYDKLKTSMQIALEFREEIITKEQEKILRNKTK